MCCRRYTPSCSRTKTLKFLGLDDDDDAPTFTNILVDEGTGRRTESSGCSSTQRCLCCCSVMIALSLNLAAAALLVPREPSWQVSDLRLRSLTPPSPGGSPADLRLEFAATVSVRNPNIIGATTLPSRFSVYYQDTEISSSALEEMAIDAQSSESMDVTVPVAGVPGPLAQAMMEDIADRQGVFATETRLSVVTRLPLLKVFSKHFFTYEVESMTKCTLTSDVQHLPEFRARKCSTSSSAHYVPSD
uniref:Late embryogenesis abundant protein LEA-2 subgroup domain-containing protein n=1 Tax=Alexandrium monilatum TaxID=311494 RepID=A0A7S4SMJ1_9DINO